MKKKGDQQGEVLFKRENLWERVSQRANNP